MAPLQSTLRRALGTFKDQTSISILKVAGSACTELDIALVKATSHEEVPLEDKYSQEILHLTSFSRGYVSACVCGLAKRLSKTHNWVVAIKALMLTHRLLRDGDPSFEQELLYCSRHGVRVLNLSNFRDDSHAHAWDYSAFVRTYALFLDEKLDFNLTTGRSQAEGRSGDRRGNGNCHGYNGHSDDAYGYDGRRDDAYAYDGSRDESFEQHGYGSRRDDSRGYGYDNRRDDDFSRNGRRENGYDNYRDDDYSRNGRRENGYDQSDKRDTKKKITTVKDMNSKDLLERIPLMQRLLERVLACRPTGAARTNRLVQIALYPVVRESFLLYSDICDAMAIILDAFFDLEHTDCVKAFELYSKGAKQIDELASFYRACKDYGVCRSSEYPVVQKVSEELLETMDDFLKDRSDSRHRQRKSPEPQPKSPEPVVEDTSYDVNGMKALPAPPGTKEPETEEPLPTQKQESEPDLVNLKDEAVSAEEHGDRLALALFSDTGNGGTQATSNGASAGATGDQPLAGWELALVESTSDLSKPATNALAGGFDNLLLTSMYDQALANQKRTSMVAAGSASSVALPGQPASSYLALPAPATAQVGGDPFAASLLVPPPPFVQMSDMKQKQQLLVQEQQVWYQYQRDGMQGYNGLMKYQNPVYNSFQYYQPVPYYGATYY